MTDLPPPPGPAGFPPPPPAAPPPGWGPAPPPPYGAYPGQPLAAAGYGPPLANFGERLLAKLLDWLILGIAPTIITILGVVIIATGPDHVSTCSFTDYDGGQPYSYDAPCTVPDGSTIAAGVLVFALAGGVALLQYVYYFRREGRTGLTWGRKAMGIRLVGLHTGQPIGSWQAFGRGLFASAISGALCYLGYLWMLWDPQRQCWHDKVVESMVVKG